MSTFGEHEHGARREALGTVVPPQGYASGVPLYRHATIDTMNGGGRPLSIVSEQLPLPIVPPLSSTGPDSTPLPALTMTVLSIALLGEFLTACVSMPYLLFMIEGFTEFNDVEQDVGLYAGFLTSIFFLGQFITSVPWSFIAARYNARIVLTTSLTGAAISCFAFGLCTSFRAALAVRFAQGLFAGSAGVARSCVGSITDSTNESRAYAIIGFFWGVGGVLGSVIGGMTESPAYKWPAIFGSSRFLLSYPYALPTSIAASIILIGAVMSVFLAPDGGPRQHLSPLKEKSPGLAIPPTIPEDEPLLSSPRGRASRLHHDVEYGAGLARDYGSVRFRDTPPSRQRSVSIESTYRRPRRSVSIPKSSLRDSTNTFVERIVEAQENRVSNVSDLWVAAALSAEATVVGDELMEEENDKDCAKHLHKNVTFSSPQHAHEDEAVSANTSSGPIVQPPSIHAVPLSSRNHTLSISGTISFQDRFMNRGQPPFPAGSGPLPSDFGAPMRFLRSSRSRSAMARGSRAVSLARSSVYDNVLSMRARTLSITTAAPPEEIGMSALPWPVLAQYGILALHTTMHDMIFMPFFVTKYEHGGLGRAAADFSQLTALMCLCQIACQFVLYPLLSGRVSHLSILRLGCILYIPAYLGSTLLHFLASPEDVWGALDLGSGLVLTQAIRYCGNTVSFTAVAILINCASPPPVLGLANGVGQGIVSLARCIGPILGGYVWSTSMNGNPNGFYIPFFTLTSLVVFALLNSLAF